ncbi:hypothetical protein B0H13DRAFT_2348610 [Mycena leptocephala]|nr:hypothetical protein B0H13DRAFT_2348610 [Mycena leptocephala]
MDRSIDLKLWRVRHLQDRDVGVLPPRRPLTRYAQRCPHHSQNGAMGGVPQEGPASRAFLGRSAHSSDSVSSLALVPFFRSTDHFTPLPDLFFVPLERLLPEHDAGMSPVPVHSVSEATRHRHRVPALSPFPRSLRRGESLAREECLDLERTLSFLARVDFLFSSSSHPTFDLSPRPPLPERDAGVYPQRPSSPTPRRGESLAREECLELERTLSVPVTCARFSDLPATACINPRHPFTSPPVIVPHSLELERTHIPLPAHLSLPNDESLQDLATCALLPSPSYTLLYRPMQSLHSPPAVHPHSSLPPLPLPSNPSTHAFRGRSYGSTGVIISAVDLQTQRGGVLEGGGDAQYLDEFGCRCTYQCGARALSLAGGRWVPPDSRVALLFAQCVSGSSMMARDARVNGDEREKGRKAAIVLDRPSSRAPYCTHFARGARRAPQT